jgi:hypothetical protein
MRVARSVWEHAGASDRCVGCRTSVYYAAPSGRCWSPSPRPARHKPDGFECVAGWVGAAAHQGGCQLAPGPQHALPDARQPRLMTAGRRVQRVRGPSEDSRVVSGLASVGDADGARRCDPAMARSRSRVGHADGGRGWGFWVACGASLVTVGVAWSTPSIVHRSRVHAAPSSRRGTRPRSVG